jgi:hypothetical protein
MEHAFHLRISQFIDYKSRQAFCSPNFMKV